MKITVTRPVEIEATSIRIIAPVKYGEEDIPFDFPFRQNNIWCVVVDIDTGVIRNWPSTTPKTELHMKVTDGGTYELYNPAGDLITNIVEDYVPDCIPGAYGDYLVMTIEPTGKIKEWKAFCTALSLIDSFFPRKAR